MLPDLLVPLAAEFQPFNLFRYITFRTGGATITALILSLMFGPMMIRWLKTNQGEGQPIRDDGPESHLITKVGTPTMGGLLILGAFALSTILWMPLSNPYLWPVLAIALSFGVIGSVDDWMKLRRRSHRHVRANETRPAVAGVLLCYADSDRIVTRPAALRHCRAVSEGQSADDGAVICPLRDAGNRWLIKRSQSDRRA